MVSMTEPGEPAIEVAYINHLEWCLLGAIDRQEYTLRTMSFHRYTRRVISCLKGVPSAGK